MSKPLVHVLVINWNGEEHLEACFDSLLKQTYDNFCIILVDNASTDDSVKMVQDRFGADPRVEILDCGSNLGWSRGNNVGIDRALNAGADFVLLFNNDTATAADAIERLVEFAEQHPRAGAVAPKMLLFDQPFLINSVGIACSIVGSAWDEGLGRADGPRWCEPKKVLGVCGGAMFLRAEALRAAGILPDDFEIYLDDLDLCLRIWDAGYECWSCPSATVRHKFSATMGEGGRAHRKYYLNTRNRLRLILRNFPASRFASVLAQYAVSEVRSIGRATLNGEAWKLAAHLQSWFAAIGYLPKAMAQRRSAKNNGRALGRFWQLVRTDIRFFPGIELPNRGWYTPRSLNGTEIRPISSRATAEVSAGELSVTHANCYPHLGATNVELQLNGRAIANLIADGAPRTERFAVEAGTLELVSRRLFDAESTGETFDIGGWIALHPSQSE
jgi:hypothetical protein